MRLLALAVICVTLGGCDDLVDNHKKESPLIANERSDMLVGRAAVKAWAAVSKEDRAQILGAIASQRSASDAADPTMGIVVLDHDLPLNTSAVIIADPEHNGGHLVVFARSTYSDALFALVSQALGKDKHDLISQHDRIHITASAMLTDKAMRPLAQLAGPDAQLMRTSETLSHLMASATSVDAIELPDFGKGTIYRFN